MKRLISLTVIIIAISALYFGMVKKNDSEPIQIVQQESSALANVIVPDMFSENAQIGKRVFEAKCATCHGANAAGQNGVAPPLVHKYYEPNHHGDEAFQRAAALGVRSHHWPFGDMPPVKGVTRSDVAMIIAYVRELQKANGIF